jgi:hypothetical protein
MKAGINAKVADELAFGKRPSAMSADEAAVDRRWLRLIRSPCFDLLTFRRGNGHGFKLICMLTLLFCRRFDQLPDQESADTPA